jgi:hypothetical protein
MKYLRKFRQALRMTAAYQDILAFRQIRDQSLPDCLPNTHGKTAAPETF